MGNENGKQGSKIEIQNQVETNKRLLYSKFSKLQLLNIDFNKDLILMFIFAKV